MMPRFSLLLPTTLLVLGLPVSATAQDKPAPEKGDKKPAAEQGEKGEKGAKGDKVDFVAQILPILEKNCVECHKAPHTGPDGKPRRPKGGVILDSKDGITASKKGKLVIAKKPDDSKMVAAISLPADDEDRMPPAKKGDPLPKDQIDLIKKWIEQGADFGTWTGAGKGDKKAGDDKKPGEGEKKGEGDKKGGDKGKGHDHEELAELGAGLAPLGDDVKAQLAAIHARLEPVADDSPLVRVSFLGAEDAVTDATVAQLAIAAPHIAELVLARTKVTDAAGVALAKLTHLVALDLRETAFGDLGVQAIAPLPHLRSLNLYATRTGDAGAEALAAAPALRELFLWQTPVTAPAVVALQQQLPHSRIVFAPTLPEPLAEEDTPARGRRNR